MTELISVRDCSLGKNYPVTATIIVDKSRGTFGIKFGAHLSFAVSVERNLTEALQGKKMQFFTSQNIFSNESDVLRLNNFSNIARVGTGFYSTRLFTDKPDWEFKPWDYWAGLSNREFFKKMLAIIKGEGYRPLFRDSSHLGFPACYILVPGFSEISYLNETRIREMWTSRKVIDSISRFPELSSEEEKRLLRLIRFKEYSAVEHQLKFIMNRPIKEGFMSLDRVGAFLALKRGIFERATHFFQKIKNAEHNESERLYLDCLIEYTRLLSRGIDRTATLKIIKKLFRDEIAARVVYEVEDPAEMIRRVFPQMKCFDCKNCELSEKYCDHPSLAISIERTLTEALQGKTIENFTSNNKFGSRAEIEDYHNAFNAMKVGYGFFPPELLTGKPSWEFSAATWENWQSATNEEYLKKLVAHVKAQGYHLLIRDSSHMGFKSYHVLIA